jgi:Cu(I)/Ag(I) efflux system membrane fusion protein
MTRKLPAGLRAAAVVILGALLGGADGGRDQPSAAYGLQSTSEPVQGAPSAARTILYYRDPGGAPFWSAGPKKDAQGRDYLPVYDDEEPQSTPAEPKRAAKGRILYYRNPMGLPDVSPLPKKDSMGMDYIPVYEDEADNGGNTVKISLDKVQRSGVKTEAAQLRSLTQPVRAVGTIDHDESRVTVVTVRAEGYIEDLFVNKTGQHVHAGEPLFRMYSPDIQRAQVDLLVSRRVGARGVIDEAESVSGAMQKLRNLGVPESHIKEVRDRGTNPRTVDWPSPASGDVIEKKIVNGQRVMPGTELYRIADHDVVWVIADVAEADLHAVNVGTHATITLRAYPAEPAQGQVTFIYPELKPETRTARVRIELPNADGRLKVDMYADVVFQGDTDQKPVVTVPDNAVIDSGTRQVILIAKGQGRFEPRAVKLGRRGNGAVEVREGVSTGEEVVTAATFLIDAESNLKAALAAFAQSGAPK